MVDYNSYDFKLLSNSTVEDIMKNHTNLSHKKKNDHVLAQILVEWQSAPEHELILAAKWAIIHIFEGLTMPVR